MYSYLGNTLACEDAWRDFSEVTELCLVAQVWDRLQEKIEICVYIYIYTLSLSRGGGGGGEDAFAL